MSEDNTYILNRKGQQKRVEVFSEKDGVVTTSLGEFPSEAIVPKQDTGKEKAQTSDNLDNDSAFAKQSFGRDNIAHHNRYSYVTKNFKGGGLLDIGSGIGQLPEHIYRNRGKATEYIGVEFSQKNIDKALTKLQRKKDQTLPEWMSFMQHDMRLPLDAEVSSKKWEIITAFEIIEHLGVDNGQVFLDNIKACMDEDTTLLLSAPVYSHKVGAFSGHIIDGEVNEYTYDEMKDLLQKNFEIVNNYGTFMSVTELKGNMTEAQEEVYKSLYRYYTTNELAWMMAPMFPEQSRNVLWELKLKG